MNEERLDPPSAFAERVAALLGERDRGEERLPALAELSELVVVSFHASLHPDESRVAKFTLLWLPEAPAAVSLVELQAPVAATPKNIAKLAQATLGDATALAVRAGANGQLMLWALVQQGSCSPLGLAIRSVATGVVRVDHSGVPIALYARGEIRTMRETDRSAARALSDSFADWRADPAGSSQGVDGRAHAVVRIALEALEGEHGGMILVIPRDVVAPRGVRIHYEPSAGSDVLSRRFAAVVDGVARHEWAERVGAGFSPAAKVAGSLHPTQARFRDAAAFVARLTAIDNAVVLDTDLRLRGFGVQVIEAGVPQQTFDHLDPYTGERHDDDLGTYKGTRHPAGVIFCMQQPTEAAAIIISQDGRLTLALRGPTGRVSAIGPYEHGYGWI